MSNSRTIPVRMPDDLYQEIIASKPPELKVSTYLLLLLRKGINAGGKVLSPPSVGNSVQKVDELQDNVLITSLQSQITNIAQQLEAVQNIANDARNLHAEEIQIAVKAAIQEEMTEILGESVA